MGTWPLGSPHNPTWPMCGLCVVPCPAVPGNAVPHHAPSSNLFRHAMDCPVCTTWDAPWGTLRCAPECTCPAYPVAQPGFAHVCVCSVMCGDQSHGVRCAVYRGVCGRWWAELSHEVTSLPSPRCKRARSSQSRRRLHYLKGTTSSQTIFGGSASLEVLKNTCRFIRRDTGTGN
jgi:hypothetical protein